MVQFGLRVGDLYAGLDGSHRLAEAAEETRYVVRAALFYPLVVCWLAIAGLALFCLYFVPTLEAVHADLELDPGAGLLTLRTLLNTMPYWIVTAPPVLLLIAFCLRRRSADARGMRPAGWLS